MSTYVTPTDTDPASPPEPPPEYRLFDARSVLIASILGSPVAGTTLMALNYRRQGKAQKAIAAVVIGIVATVLGSLLGYFVPAFATTVVGVTLALATKGAAQYWQGQAVAQHVLHGGTLSSKWAAAGLGIAFLAVFCGVIFLGALGLGARHRVVIGSHDEVYYVGSATEQDARALGAALKTAGYFQDRGFTVVLSKDKDGTAISFVVKDGVWDQPPMLLGFQQIGRQLAPSVGGLPIQVRLINSLRETKKELTVAQ